MISETYEPATELTHLPEQYFEILNSYNISYIEGQHYLNIRQEENFEGWHLFISVVKPQIAELIALIIPYLEESRFSYSVIKDLDTAHKLFEGKIGQRNIGKIITICLPSNRFFDNLLHDLINLTEHFKGPEITCSYRIGNVIYLNYHIETDQTKSLINRQEPNGGKGHLKDNITWPFLSTPKPQSEKKGRILNKRYYPIEIIKSDAKGSVFRALYLKNTFKIKSCIIKEGRENMFYDR